VVEPTHVKKYESNWIISPSWDENKKPLKPPTGGFLKWWYPTTMGFPTKNDHFGVFWDVHYQPQLVISLRTYRGQDLARSATKGAQCCCQQAPS